MRSRLVYLGVRTADPNGHYFGVNLHRPAFVDSKLIYLILYLFPVS